METKLFNEIIFGPIQSRRLGASLGVNLLPIKNKICNLDCIYCECGWTDLKSNSKITFLSTEEILSALKLKLMDLIVNKTALNSITFAGNGEPTLHPNFAAIIDGAIILRDKFFPMAHISVLSNSLMLHRKDVVSSLKKIDKPILKLDAGSDKFFRSINHPLNNRSLEWVVAHLKKFNGNLIIQTMFLKAECNGIYIDNTADLEVEKWIELLKDINPLEVMIYSIDRPTAIQNIDKIPYEKLIKISEKVQLAGIRSTVY